MDDADQLTPIPRTEPEVGKKLGAVVAPERTRGTVRLVIPTANLPCLDHVNFLIG
ncbi:hypothetical protein [Kocuria tytonicola]|uniref:hypothetical protein n=1 Tax=Kocuria tytonicola TaxID=2055946 RepID=UPI00140267EA|nr:hypothetical protein [Kocuria tytonicola]